MFDKNYKTAMDNITVDEQTRERILDRIILKEELKNRKNPAVPWRIAFACVACVAIVMGIIFVPKDNFKPIVNNNENVSTALKVSKSYNEIYELIKPKKDFSFWNNFYAQDDAVEYEIFYESIADEEGAPSSTKPGASVDVTTNNTANNLKGDGENDGAVDTGKDFSNTTEQVEGVNEADIVKTDGNYIYYIKGTTFSIFKADGKNSKLLSKTELSNEYTTDYGDMLLKDDRVIILQPDTCGAQKSFVSFIIYDVSDRQNPKKLTECRQDGWYNTSRMIGDYIYLISNCHINTAAIDKDDPSTFVPTTETNGVCEPVPADSIYRYDVDSYKTQYTVIGAYNYKDGKLSDTASLLGGTDNVYCSGGNIILADTTYSRGKTESDDDADQTVVSRDSTTVSRLAIKEGKIEYKYSGEIDGVLKNQFFIDEHNGYFRFVTTVTESVEKRYKFENQEDEVISYSNETFAHLTVLDSELKKTGEITDIAKGERVYSVRFMGDIAYFVTFRQTDPLFSVDLSNPQSPKILGQLKIPGFSEYMYPYGDGLLLGFGMDANEDTGRTTNIKLSMFNITDPANVTEQDKTLLDGFTYSGALYNHKAMLVHEGKNLIGFAATSNYYYTKYMVYEYTEIGFVCKASLDIENDYKYAMDDIRGLFIGDEFYVIGRQVLHVYDINTFEPLATIKP